MDLDPGRVYADEGAGGEDSTVHNTEPFLARWWGLLVIAYVALLCLFLGVMANQTFGR